MTDVQYEVTDGVALITMSAPQRRNALTPQMAAELVRAIEWADLDDDVGAIVLSGGGSFCAGADRRVLEEVRTDPADDASYRTIEGIYEAFLRVGAAKSLSIAAVRGAAVGAGLNLALATDLRIVAHDARLVSGFGTLGVHPGGGHFALLSSIAGREAAAAMGLLGCELSGTRAVEIGVAWQAADDADVLTVALDLARQIARDPSLARRMVASFRQESWRPGTSWDVGVHVERAPQMWSFRRKSGVFSKS